MTGAPPLGGSLVLHPGRPAPNIASTRAALASRLARGRRARDVPELLATVFRLCGDAHRLAAGHAIAAARGGPAAHDPADGVALQRDTLREHLRRLWLEWPPALAGRGAAEADLVALRDCPLMRRGAAAPAAAAATRAWVERHVVGQPADAWLAAWCADPAGALDRWTACADTLPARVLRAARDVACALTAAPRPRVRADAASLQALASSLRADEGFALAPRQEGGAAETGPWTRLADATPGRWDTAWLRLGARLAEAVRLALPDADDMRGARWLRHGALALAPGEGLAWCEMARGLLVHRVRLEDPAAQDPVVAECDVVAPTEWNFHPHGPVAAALAQLPVDGDEAMVRVLAAAFDPCVAIAIHGAAPCTK